MHGALHLEFGELTQACVDAYHAEARQVAAQARHGILGVLEKIKADLKRHSTRWKNRGLLGLKRTLLGQEGNALQEENESPPASAAQYRLEREHGWHSSEGQLGE